MAIWKNHLKQASAKAESEGRNAGQKYCHLIFDGGSGGMAGVTAMHMYESLKMYKGGADSLVRSVFETMDQGGKVMETLSGLIAYENLWGSSAVLHKNLKLADLIKKELNVKECFTLKTLYPEWEKGNPFLSKSVIELDLGHGFHQQMSLGSYMMGLMFKCALASKEDQECGYRAIIDRVLGATENDCVRAIFIASLFGGEGRTVLSDMPARLFECCVSEYREKNNVSEAEAKRMVKKRLKMAEIMIGPCYKYPKSEILGNDVSDLTAGALRNFPKETEDVLSRIYYFDSNTCPVQAEISQTGAQQTNHHHFIEILVFAAIKEFFSSDIDESADDGDKIFIPRFSIPSQSGEVQKITWDLLEPFDEYRRALLTRLRFDAFLMHVIRPQIFTRSGQVIGADQYARVTIVSKLYSTTGENLTNKLNGNPKELEKLRLTIEKLAALIKREEMFVEWFFDIAVTGKDWQMAAQNGQEEDASSETDLVKITELLKLINKETCKLTQYDLDELTRIESNKIQTGKKLDDVYSKVSYRHSGQPRDILEILKDLYDRCRC